MLCKFTFTYLQCIKLHLQCKWKPCHGLPHGLGGEEFACVVIDKDSISGWKDPLEEEMATHSHILSGKIPWTEEPAELQSCYCSVTQSCPTLCDPMY